MQRGFSTSIFNHGIYSPFARSYSYTPGNGENASSHDVIDVVPDEVEETVVVDETPVSTATVQNTANTTVVGNEGIPIIETPLITGVLPNVFNAYLAELGYGSTDSIFDDTGDDAIDYSEVAESLKEWLMDYTIWEPVPNWAFIGAGGLIIGYVIYRSVK